MYLWTGSEPAGPHNRALLEAVLQFIDSIDGPWIICGDWQFSPDMLIESGWLLLAHGVAVAPVVPTCGVAVLDYLVVDAELALYIVGGGTAQFMSADGP